ncbi:tetratricopeptide repeat protein [uncultured Anaerovibrio sp.]|uniref:tetratricopeptide repeat protein n=1 Tax=uncultured Anaerovibrio sp. TaxID=361586 RepID=UPI00261B9E2D|nr:tetratricopeptide repeat protein [uncultured Anaerovibrio sp.]
MPLFLSPSAFAERQQVEGEGSYFLMNNELEDEALAKERARYEALLIASEQAAIFVDSSPELYFDQLTLSELRSYAASVIKVQRLPQYTSYPRGRGTMYYCRLVAVADTNDFKHTSIEYIQKSRRESEERNRLIREMDELKHKYARAYSEIEKQNIRSRMKQLRDKFMRNETYTSSTYNTAMAKLAYNDGLDYDNDKDYSNAIKYYQKALSYDPRYVPAYNNLGIIYEDVLMDYEKARECFETSVQIDPAYDFGYCNLGILYNDVYHDYDKAMENYRRVLRLNPKFPGIYRYIARTYLAMEQYEDALSNVQKEMSNNKPKKNDYCLLGEIYLATGEYERAMEVLEKAISMDKDYAEAYLYRGLTYEQMGNKFQALKDISKAKELDPNNEKAIQNYSRLQ